MRRYIPFLLLLLVGFGSSVRASAQSVSADTEARRFCYFDRVTFYDVYAGTVSADDHPLPPHTLRLSNSRYARPLPAADLALMGDTLRLEVMLEASCDNYDRIGNVSLTLQPKGTSSYNDSDNGYLGRLGSIDQSIRRIEIGRFITPFFNKNKQPNVVPYSWDVSFLAPMFHDKALLDTCDIWIELTVEGVPYSANQQVQGCSGRNDVFVASATLVSNAPSQTSAQSETSSHCVVKPFVYHRYLHNYSDSHTDEPGTTTAHYTMHVDEDLTDAMFLFVCSNHGANDQGEEYVRRLHYVFVNEWMSMVYRPGRQSCEPFRQYSTMGNFIYGTTQRTDSAWQAFSNWCPGDIIDNRIIRLGAIPKGDYDFRLLVPDAEFHGGDGYFPFSLTFFGLSEGQFAGIDALPSSADASHKPTLSLVFDGKIVMLQGEALERAERWQLLDLQGRRHIVQPGAPQVIDMQKRAPGVYLIVVEMNDGSIETYKFFN